MFTGIIDHCGTIAQLKPSANGVRIGIQHSFPELVLGESIAIDGVCLTVTAFHDNLFYCDVSPETLQLTTLNQLTQGGLVNLERALQLSSRLGGHMVMGHVDQTTTVTALHKAHDFLAATFHITHPDTQKFLIKKGSVAINGVSLTINEVASDSFSVMLIPHTLENTNLKQLQTGTVVNIEFDMLTRIVAKQLENLIP